MSGGVAFGVPTGGTYADPSLPSTGNSAASDLSSAGVYDGNVFLLGLSGDPIVLNGQVFVEGDLVISGPVTGTGQVFASGNIYFVGDTTYLDAPGAYGEALDGSKNLVSYATGGNILIGDYLTPKKDINGDAVNVALPGYLTLLGIDPGGPANSGYPSSFTMSEVTLFNAMEYDKAQVDASYTPRYYALRSGDPTYMYTGTREHGDKYNGDFTVFTPAPGDAVVSLSPDRGWISELFLKQAWLDDEESRATDDAFRVDGLLYTNNAIMGLARSSKHGSKTLGQLVIRGGLVGADIGILSPGDKNSSTRGFQLLYDKRVSSFLSIEDITNLQYSKSVRIFR